MQETWIQSLGWEDPLEKEMATHSSILAWKNPWTEEPSGLQSMGSQRVGHDCSNLACMHINTNVDIYYVLGTGLRLLAYCIPKAEKFYKISIL